MKKSMLSLVSVLLVFVILFSGCELDSPTGIEESSLPTSIVSLDEIPDFSGSPYVEVNGNQPSFSEEERTTEAFESYSELDTLGRCGVAYACVGQELMPTEDRGSISQIKPSGWQSVEYDFVDGKYLYNRCHLIGFQLTAENANEKNLITGTRFMNVEGMLPFENMVADYIKETGNHVMYRVTPVFEGDDLVAKGVEMEALSVEDEGDGVCFHVYVYNNQPGVTIDYQTGESWAGDAAPTTSSENSEEQSSAVEQTYILNVSSHKFHRMDCPSVETMKEKNKETFTGTRDELIAQGYEPCQNCQP